MSQSQEMLQWFELGYNLVRGAQKAKARKRITELRTGIAQRSQNNQQRWARELSGNPVAPATTGAAVPDAALPTADTADLQRTTTAALADAGYAAPAAPSAPAAPAAPSGALPTALAAPAAPAAPAPAGALPVGGLPSTSPAQGGLPTPAAAAEEEDFAVPAYSIAELSGLISQGEFSGEEEKAILDEFYSAANEAGAFYATEAFANWGTPRASRALELYFNSLEPGANYQAKPAADGTLALIDLSDEQPEALRIDRNMTQLFAANAAAGKLDVFAMSAALQQLDQKNAQLATLQEGVEVDAFKAVTDRERVAQSAKDAEVGRRNDAVANRIAAARVWADIFGGQVTREGNYLSATRADRDGGGSGGKPSDAIEDMDDLTYRAITKADPNVAALEVRVGGPTALKGMIARGMRESKAAGNPLSAAEVLWQMTESAQ